MIPEKVSCDRCGSTVRPQEEAGSAADLRYFSQVYSNYVADKAAGKDTEFWCSSCAAEQGLT